MYINGYTVILCPRRGRKSIEEERKVFYTTFPLSFLAFVSSSFRRSLRDVAPFYDPFSDPQTINLVSRQSDNGAYQSNARSIFDDKPPTYPTRHRLPSTTHPRAQTENRENRRFRTAFLGQARCNRPECAILGDTTTTTATIKKRTKCRARTRPSTRAAFSRSISNEPHITFTHTRIVPGYDIRRTTDEILLKIADPR